MLTDQTPQAAAALTERLLHEGAPVLAYNAAQVGLQRWPQDVRLRQLQALALARSGDVERANRLLAELAETGGGDVETLGLLARTHKDLALGEQDPARRAVHLAAAFEIYANAFATARANQSTSGALYAGINAATMAVLRGNLQRGRAIASEVRAICVAAHGYSDNDDKDARYWKHATLGEAALILGETAAAVGHYAQALACAGRRYGDVGSTRRQARLLAQHLPGEFGLVFEAMRIPPVLAFSGHMTDAPGRSGPRFPAGSEALVRARLRARLAALAPLAVYVSAARGADILCLELVRELGAETHIVLPFPPAEFRRASVDAAGADWGERFERVLAAADSLTIASDDRARDSTAAFEYANLVLTGMAVLRAQSLDTEVRGLALWDQQAPGLAGGTASVVALWRQRGMAVEHVDPAAPPGAARAAVPAPADARRRIRVPTKVRHEMRALLFADAIGFSHLSEGQMPGFIDGYLGAVAALNRRTHYRFEHVETAGDGMYLVFASAHDAGHYALELSALMRDFDRAACGLPAEFDLRIALHCGPVHCAANPITGGVLFTGPHTSRAARIEPVTPPGQVYGSSAFAAVAAATGAQGLALLYVGRLPLAKGYGTLGIYSVRPVR